MGFPSLTPMYGLGPYGRDAAAQLISHGRARICNQVWIYNWMKNHGQGPQYIEILLNAIPRYNHNHRRSIL